MLVSRTAENGGEAVCTPRGSRCTPLHGPAPPASGDLWVLLSTCHLLGPNVRSFGNFPFCLVICPGSLFWMPQTTGCPLGPLSTHVLMNPAARLDESSAGWVGTCSRVLTLSRALKIGDPVNSLSRTQTFGWLAEQTTGTPYLSIFHAISSQPSPPPGQLTGPDARVSADWALSLLCRPQAGSVTWPRTCQDQ